MDCLFYVKTLLTALTTNRVQIFGEWNNIGPPVVSYYTNEELGDMITRDSRVVLREKYVDPQHLPPALRPFLRRTETTLVAEMSGDGPGQNTR
jgi:hypothetical protein